MKWQDILIALCQLCFIPAMLPTLFGKNKPAFSTNILNFVLVTIIGSSLLSLRLWFAAATALPIAIIWLILSVQTHKSRE